MYFLKLRSNKKLVQKNLELVQNEKELSDLKEEVITGSEKDYERKSVPKITDENKKVLVEKIIHAMEVEKKYLEPKLSLQSFASHLDTNWTYLSFVINEHFHKSFINYVNHFRIKEARRLLSETDKDKYTIEYIVSLTGFNSRSTFNRVFKEYAGVTPSFYMRNRDSMDLNSAEY